MASNSRDTTTNGSQATINQISIYLFNSTYRIMLAIVLFFFVELDFHWAEDCLLNTFLSFSGIYTEAFWISLGMVRNSHLITEKRIS